MTASRYIRPTLERFVIEHLSDGSVAVFDRSGDAVHSLNPTAAAVWACCATPVSIEDIRHAIAATTGPIDAGAIEAAVRQLLDAGLVQHAAGARPVPIPSSRRQMLKRIAGGAAAALPVVLTLAGKEQRLLAQGCGSPLVDLTGCWTVLGEGDDEDEGLLLTLTQSGNTITGTVASGEGVSGTVSGTLCGTTLDLTLNCTIGGTCSFVATTHATNVTSNTFSGTAVTDFAASGCTIGSEDLNGAHVEEEFAATRGCAAG